ncbi:MAG TPA: hypothetical protein PKK06_07755 [Phycisphaerae bacterium]|nr:hypothetical protein [Phycisphaerae bacterium]
MSPQVYGVVLAVLCLVPVGCATPRPSAVSFGVVEVPSRDRAEVFDAAEATLLRLGYRIDQRDARAGTLSTYPERLSAAEVPAGLAGSRRTTRPRRQLAQVQVRPTGSGATVYCKVLVQELGTPAYQMLARDAAGTDVPSETAIDRDAALNEEQSTVWAVTGRDKVQERRILTAIAELFPPAPAATSAPPGS